MGQTKQRSTAAKNVAVFFVVFIVLELLILLGVAKVFKNKDVTPSFAGYSLYIMNSDEMGGSVPKGALVVAANGAPSVDGIGNAFVVENVPGIGTSVFWLAGVSSSDTGIEGVVYTVYQQKDTENAVPHIYKVRSADIVGAASTYYMTAGKILTFISSRFGMAVCLVVPLFLFVLLEVIIAIVTRPRREKEPEPEEEEVTSSVSLDDFLFGGENDRALHRHQHTNEETAENAEDKDEEDREPDGGETSDTQTEEDAAQPDDNDNAEVQKDKQEENASAPVAAEPENDGAAEQPAVKKPAAKTRSAAPAKNASASLEELMKLMEEEQKKLRDQLGNKD